MNDIKSLICRIVAACVCVTGVAMTQAVSAATFYVATNGVDDAARNGSTAAPFASIDYALTRSRSGDTILVRPGIYNGRVRISGTFSGVGVVVKSEVPYQARLRNTGMVVSFFEAIGVRLEGFDIAHSANATGGLVVQVSGFGEGLTHNISLVNNVIHDSQNNDLLKINHAAHTVLVHGNLFYNQQGHDEHIDINSVRNVIVQNNVFASSLGESGHPERIGATGSSIVIKDSNADDDIYVGTDRVFVRRNVFLNWQGDTGSSFVLVGEDGMTFFEARNVTIENNLLIGNSSTVMRTPFGVKGSRDVTIRHNTVTGNLPANESGFRVVAEGNNQAARNIHIYNNIWSNPAGSMSRFLSVLDAGDLDLASFRLGGNVYWNGGAAVPSSGASIIDLGVDSRPQYGNPLLPDPTGVPVPRLNGSTFTDGSTSVAVLWRRLVDTYAVPSASSSARGSTVSAGVASSDIYGKPRSATRATSGAVELEEVNPVASVLAVPRIDIHPARADNRFSYRMRTVWVDVFSSSQAAGAAVDFNARSMRASTIRFGRFAGGARVQLIRTGDINGDGLPDLRLRFNVRQTRLECRDRWGWLRARTIAGQEVRGRQVVRISGCPR